MPSSSKSSSYLEGLLQAWLPLTYALNAINRSMGAEDLYPFVLPPVVQEKLAFIDGCVRGATAAGV
ncbi:MAG: putative zinc-binding metallopeptidase [Solirubrobacteraceae bacterium MAG38_C4-C5]|nr:putative zinc-binding metallopeptidase [Candidatus Siliceabacter maunaloa]